MTEKLYDADSHRKEFTSRVRRCTAAGDRWAILLESSAFFPEEGGQTADTGRLGEARVLDVQLENGELVHYTDVPLPAGKEVRGTLDWEPRFRKMQNHTGEHILSGLVYRHYGFRNVGFHLGDGDVTVDFDGELSREQMDELETEGNLVIAGNAPVTCWYPSPKELASLEYRSKLDLTENVRLVRIEGCDLCACCAPHVSFTGEVGGMKILDFMRHRGGTRLHMLCGLDAMEDSRRRYRATLAISGLLSVPQLETPAAVRRLLDELAASEAALADARRQLLLVKAAALPETDGNLCLFEGELDMLSLRELVNAGMRKASGICAAFAGRDGDWKYIVGSRSIDLRQKAGELNAALRGRGGGRPEMIQGSCAASRAEIEAFIAGF